MRKLPLRLLAMLALVAAASCNDSTGPRTCSRPVTIMVSSGNQPTFSWLPACGISALTVSTIPVADEPTRVVWELLMDDRTPVASSIRYGTTPRSSTVVTPPEALVPATAYLVSVGVIVGGDARASIGQTTFTIH